MLAFPAAGAIVSGYVAESASWNAVLDTRSGRLRRINPIPEVTTPGMLAELPACWARSAHGCFQRWDPRFAPHPGAHELWYADISFESDGGERWRWNGERFVKQ